jgi:hypothetical protein
MTEFLTETLQTIPLFRDQQRAVTEGIQFAAAAKAEYFKVYSAVIGSWIGDSQNPMAFHGLTRNLNDPLELLTYTTVYQVSQATGLYLPIAWIRTQDESTPAPWIEYNVANPKTIVVIDDLFERLCRSGVNAPDPEPSLTDQA